MTPETRSDLRSLFIGGALIVATVLVNNYNDDNRTQSDKLSRIPPADAIATKGYVDQQASVPLYRLNQLERTARGNESRSRNAIAQINNICQHLNAGGISITCNTRNAVWIAPGQPEPSPRLVMTGMRAIHDKREPNSVSGS